MAWADKKKSIDVVMHFQKLHDCGDTKTDAHDTIFGYQLVSVIIYGPWLHEIFTVYIHYLNP